MIVCRLLSMHFNLSIRSRRLPDSFQNSIQGISGGMRKNDEEMSIRDLVDSQSPVLLTLIITALFAITEGGMLSEID